VEGTPATAGSKRAFPFQRRNGTLGVNVTHDNKRSQPWMAAVASACRAKYSGELLDCPLVISVTFDFAHLKGHFGSGRNAGILKASAPYSKSTKPDLSKLVRCVEDALTGVLWRDDAQVVVIHAGKRYATSDSCTIHVRPFKLES